MKSAGIETVCRPTHGGLRWKELLVGSWTATRRHRPLPTSTSARRLRERPAARERNDLPTTEHPPRRADLPEWPRESSRSVGPQDITLAFATLPDDAKRSYAVS